METVTFAISNLAEMLLNVVDHISVLFIFHFAPVNSDRACSKCDDIRKGISKSQHSFRPAKGCSLRGPL